jgi:uncharacterized membrane protein
VIRDTILGWWQRGAVRDAGAALQAAGMLPGRAEWRRFLDQLLLWSGAVALAAAVVFFVAHNWSELGKLAKFALLQALVVAAVAAYWRLGSESAAGKAALLVASILLGALLALFGQIYQTGADTWELFASWAALIAPWVLIGRFAALWMLWVAVVNLAIALYFQVFFLEDQKQLWALFAFDTLALAAWELAGRRASWLDVSWGPRLLAIASGGAITALVVHSIFDWGRQPAPAAVLVYPLWLGCIYTVYRKLLPDLFVLAGTCLSAIVVVAAFLSKHLLESGDAAGFLLIAIAVVAMGGAAGWWLNQLAREARA